MKKLLVPLVAGALGLAQASTSHAQVSTFAQFFQSPTSGNPFVYTSGAEVGALSPGTTMTYTGGNVTFRWLASPLTAGLPAGDINVDFPATLSFSLSGVQQSPNITGATITEPIQSLTWTFTSAAGGPVPAGQVLFQGTAGNAIVSGGSFFGQNGGNSATLSGSFPLNPITFTSPFMVANNPGFTGFNQPAYSYSFTSVLPVYNAHPGGTFPPITGFLNSFNAAGTGTFSAASPASVPEPGVLGLLIGSGVSGSLLLGRRRRRRA